LRESQAILNLPLISQGQANQIGDCPGLVNLLGNLTGINVMRLEVENVWPQYQAL
jgi:hypothetical protein